MDILKKIAVYLCLGLLLSSSFLGSTDVILADGGINTADVLNNSSKTINQSKIDSILQKSREVASETIENNINQYSRMTDSNQLVNYFLIEGDTGYFYEITASEEETLTIVDIDTFTTEDTTYNQDDQISTASVLLEGGIGGKATIAGNGNYISSTVTVANSTDMGTTLNGIAYIYSGFSGKNTAGYPVESDVGLQYSKNNAGTFKWKPYFFLTVTTPTGKLSYNGSHLASYNKVNDQNGFKLGSNVTMSVYRNINGNTRLSQIGTAICTDQTCYTKGDTNLTSIVELAGTNVASVSGWKVLATLGGSDDVKGKNYAKFTGINVDGVTKTPVVYGEDKATVTVGSGTATITVSNP